MPQMHSEANDIAGELLRSRASLEEYLGDPSVVGSSFPELRKEIDFSGDMVPARGELPKTLLNVFLERSFATAHASAVKG